jgi:hypothetical protein
MVKYTFAPGCALVLYKNRLAQRVFEYLRVRYGDVNWLLTCCHHTPKTAIGKCVINVCPGCDRRYRENYAEPATVNLWEVLVQSTDFTFPSPTIQGVREEAQEVMSLPLIERASLGHKSILNSEEGRT